MPRGGPRIGGNPIVRLVLRMDRRTWATATGIAIAVLLPVGGQLLLDGLVTGVNDTASRFPAPPVLFLSGDTLSTSSIDSTLAAGTPGEHLDLRVVEGTLVVGSTPVDAYAISATRTNATGTNPWLTVPAGAVRLGARLLETLPTAPIVGDPIRFLSLSAGVNLTYAGPYATADGVPALWALVPEETIVGLEPAFASRVTAILVPGENVPGIAHLRAAGLHEIATLGGSAFVTSGVAQASGALGGLALLSAIVVGLLVAHGMAIEVVQRAGEIRILREIGASPRRVASLYAAQAVFLSAVGGAIGTALGILAAHAVVSFAPLVGLPNLVALGTPAGVLVTGLLLAIVPGTAASLGPARIAGRIYRRPQGAIPSS